MRHALLALMLASPALAGECPDPPDHGAALSDLFAEVQAAETERQAQQVANRMWALWADAPDPQAQDWLDEGMTRREAYDFTGALKAFDAVIAYCPDYAEGYNQRAFVNFIRQDYEAALPDLDHALARQPRHVAAMTGRALTLIALDRKPEAALELRRALTLNPWLQERHLLPALEAAEEEL
ncbi:tetratricopeptide repeat protein [Roseovarius pacificus]|uniref:tetratricopeptide repeat protein n=1 Tax=Roseovarius pacificus TaxID=337701 RepID=UPI004039B9F9